MRSLACLSSINAVLPRSDASSSRTASALAFNPESGVVYVVTEASDVNGGATLDVYEVAGFRESQIRLVSCFLSASSGRAASKGRHPIRRRQSPALNICTPFRSALA